MADRQDDVEVLETPQVPAEKTPSNTREFFLRPPDWRYQFAVRYLEEERRGETPTIPTDPHVQYAIRILRAYNSRQARGFLEYLATDACDTIMIGVHMKHSAIAADVESCIIKHLGMD